MIPRSLEVCEDWEKAGVQDMRVTLSCHDILSVIWNSCRDIWNSCRDIWSVTWMLVLVHIWVLIGVLGGKFPFDDKWRFILDLGRVHFMVFIRWVLWMDNHY